MADEHSRKADYFMITQHADNQERFRAIEEKIDKLSLDTSELLEMWRDAGVFFKWMRRVGAFLLWLGKVAISIGSLYGLTHYLGGFK